MRHLTLQPNEKLSGVSDFINTENNSWIIAPTGCGKSYHIINKMKGKRIIAVPTQGLADDFNSQYKTGRYYSNCHEIYNENGEIKEVIAVTYNSLNKLMRLIDPKEYTIFVDEAHNFVASADKSYRHKEMNDVKNALTSFKNYHLVTATYLHTTCPILNDTITYNIRKKI